ncbi:pathogenicity island protein [Staphylococcus equorum]|uniref:pathogenicity island protein n=1 Tax=Staphylococcus equorum TaxID=246432 RepID=UPI0008533E31|nr:pathogenicity island protein [Staphylococcus equorum]OEK71092.1 pathogenicity island protein [Staphylococcus equorum]
MTEVKQIPTKRNVITDSEQIKVEPIYCKISALPKLIGVSKSTIYRVLKEYDVEPNGVEDLYVSLSATLTIVDIKKFKEYLNTKHRKWM